MQAALEILGCKPAYHAYTVYNNISHAHMWSAAFEAKYHNRGLVFTRHDWDKLLGHYGAITDTPAVCFAEELINAYPEAKIVLVEREINSWYTSFNRGVITAFANPLNRVLEILDPQLMGPVKRMWDYVFADPRGYFRASTREDLQLNAKMIYREHYALVRSITPKERLLEFDFKDGWRPLCEFLGKDEPTVPFPKLNEGDTIKERVHDFQKQCLGNVLRNLAIAVVSLAMALLAMLWAWRQS